MRTQQRTAAPITTADGYNFHHGLSLMKVDRTLASSSSVRGGATRAPTSTTSNLGRTEYRMVTTSTSCARDASSRAYFIGRRSGPTAKGWELVIQHQDLHAVGTSSGSPPTTSRTTPVAFCSAAPVFLAITVTGAPRRLTNPNMRHTFSIPEDNPG